ncbi:putative transmembrane protein [Senna tora]|uniref:Putative transmembrane protein n=1 Tax=Senna tora TaxID=362788 RepID=A0A834XBY4_9FABA|nr:putative transmembrane protein [Senna tora]
MNTTQGVALFVLILINTIFMLCSLVSISCETESNLLVDRYSSRKLLANSSSFSASIENLTTSHEEEEEDSWRSVDTSLRNAPPSNSNPIQNK